METVFASKQSQSPRPKGATKRRPLHGAASTSEQDSRTDRILEKSSNIGNMSQPFHGTGKALPPTSIEDENNGGQGKVPECVPEGNTNLHLRRSVEPETNNKTVPKSLAQTSAPEEVEQFPKYAIIDDQVKVLGCAPEDNDNLHLTRSAELETARHKVSQSPAKISAPKKEKQPSKYAVSIKHVLGILGALVGILAAYFIPKQMTSSVPKQDTHVHQSCEHFLPLASKYPNTDDMLWATLVVGVERAVNDPGEPATFIFLYNSSSVGQSLLDDVIRTTIDCFGNGDALWRTSDDFKSIDMTQDYGAVLDRHREELQKQGVLVVRDLDRVPPNAAQVFFTICDSYEPLVRKAAIFFTIDISQRAANHSQRQSPTSIAEGILKDLWRKELHSNVLDPLVVRLTENVFQID